MTGFGSSTQKNKIGTVNVQVKTVNGRFFETKFKMPKIYQSFESELRALLHKKIHRGTVDIYINRAITGSGSEESTNAISVNYTLARGWLEASRALAKELQFKTEPNLEMLLRVPDIFVIEENLVVTETEKNMVLKALNMAVDDCASERQREGKLLQTELLHLLDHVEEFTKQTEKRKKTFEEQIKENLNKKISRLVNEMQLDANRLNQEALFLIERSDVTEEITRLKAHVDAFKKILIKTSIKASGESVGKKLDFMVQELHREVNTISSKIQSLDISLDVIEAKAAVEKLREQVQNVE